VYHGKVNTDLRSQIKCEEQTEILFGCQTTNVFEKKESALEFTYFVILHDQTTGAEFLDEVRLKTVNLYHLLLDRYERDIRSQVSK
jgi:hypothetical protein